MSHDQNFKNLIIDYPRQALAFFAAAESVGIGTDARIVAIRQEQLQERLGERFRELDVPLLVEWSDGRREAIVFVQPGDFMNLRRYRAVYWFHREIPEGAAYPRLRPTEGIFLVESRGKRDQA